MLKMAIDRTVSVGRMILIRPIVAVMCCFVAGCLSAYPFKGMPTDFLKLTFGIIIIIFSILNFPKKSIITISGDTIPLLLKKFEISEMVAGIIRILCLMLLPIFFVCGNMRMNDALEKTEFKSDIPLRNVVLEGVIEKVEQTEYSLKVTINEATIERIEAAKVLAYIPFEYEEEIEKSDYIVAVGNAEMFDKATNEGEFDARNYYRNQGFSLSFKVEKIEEIIREVSVCGQVERVLGSLRKELLGRIYDIFAEDTAGIIASVLFGDKSRLPDDIKELYNAAGIGHLLSISGLHISLIGTIVINMLKKTGAGRLVRGMTAMLILMWYCSMTGFGLSTKRAFIMFCVLSFSEMFFRSYDIFSGMALAALLILYEEPFSMFGSSFLLSFSATLAIAVYVNESRKWKRLIKSRLCKMLLEVCGAGLFIQLGTLPVMLWAFNEISIYSFFINIFVIPVFTYIVAVSVVAIAASYLHLKVGIFIGGFTYYAFDIYEWLCETAIEAPFSKWCPGKPELIRIVLYYSVVFIIICIARLCMKKKRKKSLFKTLFGFLLLPLLMLPVNINAFEVCFLDVGQGDCIFFRDRDNTYLVDCGSSSKKDIEEKVIIPFFKSKGIKELDYLFLTHADGDHVNGVVGVLESDVQVNNIILPYTVNVSEEFDTIIKTAYQTGSRVFYINKGKSMKLGEVEIKCIHPDMKCNADDKNESSIVLLVSFRDFDMLLTGDIGSETEKKITELDMWNEGNTQIEVLKCAHHGSRYSSTEEFLTFVKPMMAIISCSVDNTYGHPHVEVLERLQKADTRVYTTKDIGQITVVTNGIKIKAYGFTP